MLYSLKYEYNFIVNTTYFVRLPTDKEMISL